MTTPAEAPKSVLVVEDEQSIRDILTELFDVDQWVGFPRSGKVSATR